MKSAYKQYFYKSNAFISNIMVEISKNIKQKLSNTLRLNFYYLNIIHFLDPYYRPKLTRGILKMCKKYIIIW